MNPYRWLYYELLMERDLRWRRMIFLCKKLREFEAKIEIKPYKYRRKRLQQIKDEIHENVYAYSEAKKMLIEADEKAIEFTHKFGLPSKRNQRLPMYTLIDGVVHHQVKIMSNFE